MKTNLKRLLILLLVLGLLSGCGKNEQKDDGIADALHSALEGAEKTDSSLAEALNSAVGGGENTNNNVSEAPSSEASNAGSTDEDSSASFGHKPPAQTYAELSYSRPDYDACAETAASCMKVLDSDPDEAAALMFSFYEQYLNYCCMYSLAGILSSKDVTDTFASEENIWCSEAEGKYDNLLVELALAVQASPYAERLEAQAFWQEITEDMDFNLHSDREIELRAQEAELVEQYYALSDSPTIIIDGIEYDYESLEYSAETLKELEEVYAAYREQCSPAIAEIYIQLMAVRAELAEECGYDNYRQMQYEYSFQREYSPKDTDEYLKAVKTQLLPLYGKMESAGVNSGIIYEDMSISEVLSLLDTATARLGGRIRDAYEQMTENGNYDILPEENKASTSFTTYIYDYNQPFIFMDSCGEVYDLSTLFHEFGHYADMNVDGNTVDLDIAEVFSTSFPVLTAEYLTEQLGGEFVEDYRAYLIFDLVETIVFQSLLAEFEERAYELPADELSEERLSDLFAEVYSSYYDLSDIGIEWAKTLWTQIPHYFEFPFYVISYAVSSNISLQLAVENEQKGNGPELYNLMLDADHEDLNQFIEDIGLLSPFSSGTLSALKSALTKLFM